MNKMKKILVVDDQITNIETLRYRLKKAGYNVLEALRGDQAIELAQKEVPDLVLLDIMMPEITGFEVCEILLKEEKTKHIPIILVTALSSPEYVQKGFEAGAYDYVKKPFNHIELMMRIKSALKTSQTNKLLKEVNNLNIAMDKLSAAHSSFFPKINSLLEELGKVREILEEGKISTASQLLEMTIKNGNEIIEYSESELRKLIESMRNLLHSNLFNNAEVKKDSLN